MEKWLISNLLGDLGEVGRLHKEVAETFFLMLEAFGDTDLKLTIVIYYTNGIY
ncbi:MAG: hypothetical protein GXO48_02615 [Chlorobi bacterium]|nr:hypothetical protein [Chlorobiota bacterium]